jgi:hypothetical protein
MNNCQKERKTKVTAIKSNGKNGKRRKRERPATERQTEKEIRRHRERKVDKIRVTA